MDTKPLALVLFIAAYILLLALPAKKHFVAAAAAALFIVLGVLPPSEVLAAVNWNVLMMIAGTMGVVSLFIESRAPALLGDFIISKTGDIKWVVIWLSVCAGLISAFVDNVATVLIIAPIAVNLFKRLKIAILPEAIICISLASNLQGAATLVGDTTSIMLAGALNMNFLDFFVYARKPGMFFVVELSAVTVTFVLYFLLRKLKAPVEAPDEKETVTDFFPSFLLSALLILLIIGSFIPEERKPGALNGIICLSLLAVGMAREAIAKKGFENIKDNLLEIDINTLTLLTGLFLIVAGVVRAGVIDDVSALFLKISGSDVFAVYTLIVWFSVFISAFVDNIPYVAAMLPVAASLTAALGVKGPLLYFALLSGATLGGNLTPVGASANITALGILKKEGVEVSAKDFFKLSVPFTISAVLTGYVLIWVIWA